VTTEHSRRQFLTASGAFALSGWLVACGSGGERRSGPTTETTAGASGSLIGDLQMAALAASIENLVVSTYQMGLDAAAANRLGGVPPAVMTFLQTAKRHHQDHAAAWNAILTSAGKTRVTDADEAWKPQVEQAFGQVRDFAAMARVALNLETVAAATYLNAIGIIQNSQALKTATTIHPVELQHAAILNVVLGNDPAADAFARADGARPLSDYPG
jgi:Ferritin-like domain